MDELMGFAVLYAGQIAVLVSVVIGALVVWAVVGGDKTRRRWVKAVVALLVVALIPTWDEILGRWYFHYLCRANAGVKIFKTVQLGPEHLDVKLPEGQGSYRRSSLAKSYPYVLKAKENLPGPARITYVEESIQDGKTGATLARATNYHFRGGWFRNTFSIAPVRGFNCNRGENYFIRMLKEVFGTGSQRTR